HFSEDLLLSIFTSLSISDIVNVSLTCKQWWRVSQDDLLWKDFFLRDFQLKKGTCIAGGKTKWKDEYKRLKYHTPCIESQELKYHKDQVLHVCFSNNGELFATSSKDGTCKVWTSSHPCQLVFEYDMKKFHWKYTQFSQFNKSDTLLLVSGVHFGEGSTSGEIAVFSIVDNFELQSRMINKPYDIFGTWYNDTHLLSGSLYWTGQLNSCSALWLNMASQAIETENESVVMRLFKFHNENASSIRTIMIANCYSDYQRFFRISHNGSVERTFENKGGDDGSTACASGSSTSQISESCLKHLELDDLNNDLSLDDPVTTATLSCDNFNVEDAILSDSDQYLCDKLLIFTLGSAAYTPHQIGLKRIKCLELENTNSKRDNRGNILPNVANNTQGRDRTYDKVDKILEMDGHIIGMSLSPDNRFLYVNCRPWPKNYKIDNPLQPPPLAQEIDIHVIDLYLMQEVGTMLKSHKAYTANDECFFIFLNVSEEYVASGAEDKHGYMWDRHYGMCLQKFQHNDVVNSVAFNPINSEMLVTVSDDYSIKVWRSK
ncbi:hypothetical protein LOTGIDRAFT_92511, partial [Lottia gigantea]